MADIGNTDLLHKIVQLRETSTNDYLYPITLIDAVKDKYGIGINQIMNERLIALRETINNRIDQTDQNVSLLRSSKVSAKESLLSSLAVYYLKGQSQLDLSTLYNISSISIYYSDKEPSEFDTTPHYWIDSNDKASIKYFNGTEYVSVEQDIAIFIYSTLSEYLMDTGSISLYISTEGPLPDSSYNDGDVYLYITGDNTLQFMYLSNRWVSMLSTNTDTVVSNLSIDTIVDLVSIRYLSISYSSTNPGSSYDIWYDGSNAYLYNPTTGLFDDPISYSLDKFIGSIFINRDVGSTAKLFYGPASPRESSNKNDVWINTRSNSIYINTSESLPKWVEQTSLSNTITTISIGNLFTHTDDLNSPSFIDYTTGNSIIGALISVGIRNLRCRRLNANTSITQIVSVMANTLYTISVDADHPVEINFDRGEVLESGIASSIIDGYTRYYKTIYFDTGISVNTARIEVGNEDTRVANICMQRGQSVDWVPKISDILTLLDNQINNKISSSYIYIGESPVSGSYNISTDISYSDISMYVNNDWISISDIPNIDSSLREVGSIYGSTGVVKITTSHIQPTNSNIGDIWINDRLVAMRWIGSSWGNTDSIIMGRYRELSGTIQELSDTQLRLAFAQSSQEATDILDQAGLLNQNIQLFKQDDIPVGIINPGDLWITQTGVKKLYRWNGVEWVEPINAISRILDIEADASGLNITIGGSTGTIGNTIGTALTNSSNANNKAQNALDLIDMYLNMLVLNLSNSSVQIPVLSDGSLSDYTKAYTNIFVYHRGINVTQTSVISLMPSPGVSCRLVEDSDEGIYSSGSRVVVSNMTSDIGYVDIKVEYSGLSSTIRFNLSKSYMDTLVHKYLELSDVIIITNPDFSNYSPSDLTIYAKQKTGNSDPIDFYGYFLIGFSVDGINYIYDDITPSPTSSYTREIPTGIGYTYIKCILYNDIDATQKLDEEVLSIVVDPNELTNGLTSQLDDVTNRLESLDNFKDDLSNNVLDDLSPDSLISRVAVLKASIDEISLIVSGNYSDVGTISSQFSFSEKGLDILSIEEPGSNQIIYDNLFIHIRFSSILNTDIVKDIVDDEDQSESIIVDTTSYNYGMSDIPTDRSRYIGFTITSTDLSPGDRSDYVWRSMDDDSGEVLIYVDNDTETTPINLFWRYSIYSDGEDNGQEVTTHISEGTSYIGISLDSGEEVWMPYRNIVSRVRTRYASDGVKFIEQKEDTEVVVGKVTPGGFRLQNGIIENGGFLRMGNYLWQPQQDNSLSFTYSPE